MHFPVTALGGGRRVGIWLQGCSIGCADCISRDTWNVDGGEPVAVEDIVAYCQARAADGLTGVTISGGEPFEQPEGLAALLNALRAWRTCSETALDLLCYSGMPFQRLEREFPDILARLDALIPEPYVRTQPAADSRYGSRNQKVVCLTDLGRQRHGEVQPPTRRFQVTSAQGSIWFIGVPGPGDMERLYDAAERRGVRLEHVSWRA